MNALETIEKRCSQYLLEEPDPRIRSELEELLAKKSQMNDEEIYDRMKHHLRFGTAGLRARMEAGYNRMNIVSVYRFSYALSIEFGRNFEVVVGFDGREKSRSFAKEVAVVLSIMKANVHLFYDVIPTPLCAYATKTLGAALGVMITASHNPKMDNGIKLFDRNGAQAHGEILKRIEENMDAVPLRSEFLNKHAGAIHNIKHKNIGDEIFLRYLEDIKKTQLFPSDAVDHDVDIVYTPLHGVGKRFFLGALNQEGFRNVTIVKEQAEPDGNFPTVDFPNPEEDSLDYAYQLADEKGISFVFAHDPDADRLQVSFRKGGQFKKLSGNEMGSILGYFSILKAKEAGIKPLAASSIVSSRMLKMMCAQLGAQYVDALTGFSNLLDGVMKAERKTGHQFVFGYEEAIGFLVGQVVLDKDGINTGVRFMEIIGHLRKTKKTIWQFLDELYLRFGIFVSAQWFIRFDGVSAFLTMADFMKKVRTVSTVRMANSLGQSECQKYDLGIIDNEKNCYQGLHANVVIFEKMPVRLLVRPSGTEPKIKFYLELFDQATDLQDLSNKRSMLEKRCADIRGNIDNLFKD